MYVGVPGSCVFGSVPSAFLGAFLGDTSPASRHSSMVRFAVVKTL